MKPLTKNTPRDPASQALITLRTAMELTQQRFAVEVLKCAIGTVSRYESFGAPKGNVLLDLRAIAKKEALEAGAEAEKEKDEENVDRLIAKKDKLDQVADTFQRLWLEEVYALLGDDAKSMLIAGAGKGMLVAFPGNPVGVRASKDFATLLRHSTLTAAEHAEYRNAAIRLFKSMQEAAEAGVQPLEKKDIARAFLGTHK
jgi:hypothetical protein